MSNIYKMTAPVDKLHGDEDMMADGARVQWTDSQAEEALKDGFVYCENINSELWPEFENCLFEDLGDELDYANLIRLILGGEDGAAQDLARRLLNRAVEGFAHNNIELIEEALRDDED